MYWKKVSLEGVDLSVLIEVDASHVMLMFGVDDDDDDLSVGWKIIFVFV